MKKNIDRYSFLKTQFDSLKKKNEIKYIRVEAIDGFNLNESEEVKNIIGIRNDLIGLEFKCSENNSTWIYDGTINKSFPGLHLNGHYGTKGLTLSNLKVFNKIKNELNNYEWYCVFEDDARINNDKYKKIKKLIKKVDSLAINIDVIILDTIRKGGASAVLYNKRIIDTLLSEMHPLSDIS